MAKNEVKWGALLSYVLIIASSVYGLVIMPFVLGTIGPSEYGVYKSVGSITATLSVMELGLGGTMQKFIAQYRAQKEEQKAFNYSAMCMIQAAIMAFCMLVGGVIMYFTLDSVYGTTFTSHELMRAKQIFIVLIAYVVFHIFENVYFGLIAGYNKFVFSNSLKLAALVVKILLYFVLLPIFQNSLAIVLISLIIELIIIAIEYAYVKIKLHHRIKLYAWDRAMFKETLSYTVLLFIQSLLIQFNGNVDNIVIGAVIGTSAVTVYSFAIQIYNMYEQCATSVSGVILPSLTNVIYSGASSEILEKFVIKYGRAQWAVLGAALGGFVCLGQDFFRLWLGDGFSDCYYLTLILMIPATFPLIVNTCLAILKVKKLLRFRTIAMAYSVVVNIILTVIGTRLWGYWAAAAGTAISTLVGSVISLNIYYRIKLKFNMLKIYYRIMARIAVCIALPCVLIMLMNPYITGGWTAFLIKAAIFMAFYGLLMLLFGMNREEKEMIFKRRRKAG